MWRDINAEGYGCYVAHRLDERSLCADGECRGALASAKPDHSQGATGHATFTHRMRLGSSNLPTLQPPPNVASIEEIAAAAVLAVDSSSTVLPPNATAIINASTGPLWHAAASPEALYASVQSTLAPPVMRLGGSTITTRPALNSTTRGAMEASDVPAAVDWRTRNGGKMLSPTPPSPASVPDRCRAHASHVLAALAAAEARVRIASSGEQSESLSFDDALACGSRRLRGPLMAPCEHPPSAYLVGLYGMEEGFARVSCVGAAATAAAAASDKSVNSSGGASGDGGSVSAKAWCASLPRCPSSPRRRVRRVRFVGGGYGHTTDALLMREIAEHGPVAIALYADADLALYGSGIYHPLTSDYWRRLRGRTLPHWDIDRCHSGCVPPAALDFQEVNLGATLVGYGTETLADGASADYWVVQVPAWGKAFGEGGYAKILRSEAAIFDAVAIDPMV